MASPEYSGPEWRAVRLAVLARDGHQCQIRGPKCKGRATHVDHIVSVSQGGARLDPANLRASCASCNVGKRNAEVAARARGESSPSRWCYGHDQPVTVCGGPHSRAW